VKRKATRICDQCGDNFCDSCFEKCHKSGKRKDHTYLSWEPPEWEELYDEDTQEYLYMNTRTKFTTMEKPLELMFGQEKQAKLIKLKEEEESLLIESEIRDLKEKIENIKQERDEIIQKERDELEAKLAYSKATNKARNIAKIVAPSLISDDNVKKKRVTGITTKRPTSSNANPIDFSRTRSTKRSLLRRGTSRLTR